MFGSLILHQKGIGFLIFWSFLESCLWQHMKKYAAVDKTAETQVTYDFTHVILILGGRIVAEIRDTNLQHFFLNN